MNVSGNNKAPFSSVGPLRAVSWRGGALNGAFRMIFAKRIQVEFTTRRSSWSLNNIASMRSSFRSR